MPLSPGARLGPYEVIAPVGAGGMGEVFRARDTRLDRQVAIKILPAEFAQDAQLKLRFEREARAISQLSHPNICTLFDVGDGYLVMELLDGETLSDRLAKGPLPVGDVVKYGAQIADALDRAHKIGIVHRDLKPANVMLTKSGAKLLDFGLAKGGGQAASPVHSGETIHKPLTEEGTVLGTYQYMAPEQLAGEEADARTDIFALGAVLYEMVTGRRAFDGKTKTSIITSIVSREPSPIGEVQPFTPPALEHVVRRCLSKDPDDRWQSAHDIASQLRWISESGSGAGLAAPVLRTRRSRERMLWIAALIAVTAAGVFAAMKLHLGETPRQYRFTIPMVDAQFTNGGAPRLSPDGQTVYFRAMNGGRFRVYRRRLNELTATPVDGTEDAFAFLPSADGRSLLLSYAASTYKRVSVNGGPPETILESQRSTGGISTSSADGTILFGGDATPVSQLLLPDHRLQAITALNPAIGEVGHSSPFFLPDGKTFLFQSVRLDNRGAIHRVLCATTIGSKETTEIGEVSSRVEYAAGHIFFVRGGTLVAQPFDVKRLKLTGDAVPVVDDVNFNGRIAFASFSVAPNGTIVYQPFQLPHQLSAVDPSGKATPVAIPHLVGSRFSVSADGSRGVFALGDHATGVVSMWTYDLNRNTGTRVTFSPANEVSPVMTPDGSRIFFAGDAQGIFDIFEVPADGSIAPRLVVKAEGVQTPTDVSPDGKFLLYTTNQNGTETKQDIYVLPLAEGAKPRPFVATPAMENEGTFSRDGKWVAYTSGLAGSQQVFVRPFPGPGPARQVSTKGGYAHRFSPDGKHLDFANGVTIMSAEFHADGSTGEPAVVFESHDHIVNFEPLAGNRFLVLSQNERDAAPPLGVIVGWHP